MTAASRVVGLLCALACAVMVSGSALAGTGSPADDGTQVRLRLRTLLVPVQVDPGVTNAGWPLYQWLEMSGRGPTPGLSVHAAVWGMGALGGGEDPALGSPLSGDVNLLFAQYQDLNGRYGVRVGRQLILAGPGAGFFNQIDGLWARGAMGPFEIQAYGGQVVQARFSNFGNYDWLVGGRLGFHRWNRFSAGVSYLHARTGGALGREIVGSDAAVVITQDLDLVASAAYDLVDPGLLESRAMARWTTGGNLTLGVALEQASPARLIDKSSIFSVFGLGDYAQAETFADWAFTPQWVASARAGRVFFTSPDGQGFGEQATRLGAGIRGWLRRDIMLISEIDRLPSHDNAYTSLRLAGRLVPGSEWSGALDLLAFVYDGAPLSPPGSANKSVVARAFYDRRIGQNMHLGVGGEVGSTVLSTIDVRGLLRFTTDLDFTWGGSR